MISRAACLSQQERVNHGSPARQQSNRSKLIIRPFTFGLWFYSSRSTREGIYRATFRLLGSFSFPSLPFPSPTPTNYQTQQCRQQFVELFFATEWGVKSNKSKTTIAFVTSTARTRLFIKPDTTASSKAFLEN